MKLRKRTLLWIVLPIMLIALLAAAYLTVDALFIFHRGRVIYRYDPEVDLRDMEMSVEEYTSLEAALPDCHILWMIPVGDTYYDSTMSEIVVDSIALQDIPLFLLFDDLRRIDAIDATCYPELIALCDLLPDCEIDWAVHIGTGAFSPASRVLKLAGVRTNAAELTEKLSLFPNLTQVEITDISLTKIEQQELQEKFPSVSFVWSVNVSGKVFLNTVDSMSFKGETVDIDDILNAAVLFPSVETINLSGCGCSVDALLAVQQAYGATVYSELSLYDVTFTTDATELYFNDIPMESVAAVEQILPLLPNLKKVEMCNCGISSEEMDALWKRHPEVRFIWSVKIGRATLRTDCTNFIGMKHGYWVNGNIADPYKDAKNRLFDKDCVEFKYCVDMVCLDLGHMGITDYSFLEYMPNLKYLILVDTHGTDFSPLAKLYELIFLEIFMTDFNQPEILLNLKKLEDVNLGYTLVSDPEFLMQMTWLKRLWVPSTKMTWDECLALKAALPNTQVDYSADHSTGNGWRKSKNYYDMRDWLGVEYAD